MKREEWDWPPPRDRYRRHYQTLDVYQPTGWNSPGAKRVAHIYWRVMITIVKMLLAIPLTLMLLGSVWLLWFLVTLL
jgi:hypothetical protein